MIDRISSNARPRTGLPEEDVRGISPADTLTPADRYQELFVEVQMNQVFEDAKTFVDCVPRMHPEDILQAYRTACPAPHFDLHRFVHEHFEVQQMPSSCFVSDPERPLGDHIEKLWSVLTRHPTKHPPRSSLLPLPHPYVVPGGRFTEIYYWDSYFIMLGLHKDRCPGLLSAMADNFAYLIDTYGHVPNGNRTYYLGRSQPPVFCLMVQLFEDRGIRHASAYLPYLRKEYAFWMEGADELRPGEVHRRCVRMSDGSVLNRYWDERDMPREEAYREDVLTARRSSRPVHQVYRDLRAGAESGWDFSSRWQADPKDLSSIRTTCILPVDLNCLLFKLERQIATLSSDCGDHKSAADFHQRAEARCAAINRYMWNGRQGAYFDFDWEKDQQRENLTAAGIVPLFVHCATQDQADAVAKTVEARLLAPGGLGTTEITNTGQQWDRPNGWAPLQWMAYRGLRHYHHERLARDIEHRWLTIVSEIYEAESKLVEKYVLRPTTEHASGGEYPLQDGFGWTNGVVAKFLEEDPEHPASRCRAGHHDC